MKRSSSVRSSVKWSDGVVSVFPRAANGDRTSAPVRPPPAPGWALPPGFDGVGVVELAAACAGVGVGAGGRRLVGDDHDHPVLLVSAGGLDLGDPRSEEGIGGGGAGGGCSGRAGAVGPGGAEVGRDPGEIGNRSAGQVGTELADADVVLRACRLLGQRAEVHERVAAGDVAVGRSLGSRRWGRRRSQRRGGGSWRERRRGPPGRRCTRARSTGWRTAGQAAW